MRGVCAAAYASAPGRAVNINIFNFLPHGTRLVRPLRVVLREGAPWFALVDVCAATAHSNPSMAASRLDDDEKGISSVDTLGGQQETILISESGLYSLILTSRKPEAKAFKRWVDGAAFDQEG